jgi:hypothetical protein
MSLPVTAGSMVLRFDTIPAHEFTYSDRLAAYVACILVLSNTNKRLAILTREILIRLEKHIPYEQASITGHEQGKGYTRH